MNLAPARWHFRSSVSVSTAGRKVPLSQPAVQTIAAVETVVEEVMLIAIDAAMLDAVRALVESTR